MCGAAADESGYPSPSASTQKVKRLRDLKNDLPGAVAVPHDAVATVGQFQVLPLGDEGVIHRSQSKR
jgi:hypothetical protein